jgi:hypothetical protein
VAVSRDIGARDRIAYALQGLGGLATARGELEEATRLHREALRLWVEVGDVDGAARELWRLGALVARRGDFEAAARLLGVSDSLRESVDAAVPSSDLADYEQAVAAVRDAIGEAALAAAREGARGLDLEAVVEIAVAREPSPAGS